MVDRPQHAPNAALVTALGNRLDAELSGEALRRAVARRQPAPGLLFHSDRGSEFAAEDFRKLLAQISAVQSMSRKGDFRVRIHRNAVFRAMRGALLSA